MPTLDYGFTISHFVVAGCYFALALAAIIQLIRLNLHIHHYQLSQKLWRRQVFCILIGAGSAIRGIWFTFTVFMQEGAPLNHAVDMLLNLLPTFLFISTYTLLVTLMIHLLYSARSKRERLPPTVVTLIANAIMYLVLAVMFVLDFLNPGPQDHEPVARSVPDIVLQSVEIGCFFAIACVFTIYAWGMRKKLGFLSNALPAMVELHKKVVVTAIVCTIAFACRCVVVIVTLVDINLQRLPEITLPNYLLFDFIPVSLLLFIIAGPPPPLMMTAVNERTALVTDGSHVQH